MIVHVNSASTAHAHVPTGGPVHITVHPHDPSGGSDVDVIPLRATENTVYTAPSGKAYSPVTVAVPQTAVEPLSVTENGEYTAPSGTAYSPVNVEVPQTTIESLNVTANDTYTAPDGKAYSPVTVAVPQTTVESLSVTANGTYTAPSGKAYSPVTVNVSAPTPVTVPRRDVNFYDYDGTVVASYTAADFANLSALPANPTHDRLTAQGWNWTLSDAKTFVSTYGKLDIGQMYISASGKTEFDIELTGADLSPTLILNVNGTAVIEWGDGGTDTVTGDSVATGVYTNHVYSAPGAYRVSVTVTGECMLGRYSYRSTYAYTGAPGIFATNDSYLGPQGYTAPYSYSSIYSDIIKAVRIGPNMQIGEYSFSGNCSLVGVPLPRGSIPSYSSSYLASLVFTYAFGLKHVTIPDDATDLPSNLFSSCTSLESVSLPNSVVSLASGSFSKCYRLQTVVLPSQITSIGSGAFSECGLRHIALPSGLQTMGERIFNKSADLQEITIPPGVTAIPYYAFDNCFSLKSVTIPNGVTSIGSYAFRQCSSLTGSITIPSSVTSIGQEAFWGSHDQYIEYHILATTPPTLSTGGNGAFPSTDFSIYGSKIYVPSASVETYKAASGWSSFASYIYGE